MRKFVLSVILFLCFGSVFFCQTKNNIYVEALGNGLAYTINFEREIVQNINLRIGYGNILVRTVPIMLNYHYYFENGHSFMAGIGAVNVKWHDDFLSLLDDFRSDKWTTTLSFAYNVKMKTPGFNIRFAFTPFITSDEFIPYGGVSLGFAF
ncbi:MAG: hypothetical protein ACEPO8_06805 [Rhodothermaceae bacterium]